MYSAHQFAIPSFVPQSRQLDYCLDIIGKYRHELLPLRIRVATMVKRENYLKRQIRYWKEKYHQIKEEKSRLRQENEILRQEIEKLTTANHRYRVSLFDHGNFTHIEGKSKKPKGGQRGHADTNRETKEDLSLLPRKRLFSDRCPRCGKKINRVSAVKQKLLLDIVLNPQVVKLILESERQWCGHCCQEITIKDESSLPFTEYGINTFLMILILRFRCSLSLAKVALVLETGFGLKTSKAGLARILKQAECHLKERYQQLVKIIRKGDILYADETGWQVKGKSAWLWIMASEEATVYQASESRGKDIFKSMYGKSRAQVMHDGYKGYHWIPKEKTLSCWAHFLRFAYEETHHLKRGSPGIRLRDKLVDTYHLKQQKDKLSEEALHALLRRQIKSLLLIKSRLKPVKNIQRRLGEQKQGLINALLYSPDGTNNLAERELRPMVMAKKTSFGSDTFTGMETNAVLGSIVQTLTRENLPFIPTLKQYLQEGIQRHHPNYFFGKS